MTWAVSALSVGCMVAVKLLRAASSCFKYKRVKASESDVSKGIPRFDCDQPRMPGWCDRILWRRAADVEVKVLDYVAIESADYSDHRPVCAVLEVGRLSS
ncbi:unnamed protein product [Cladocopium goreaui]|uniref:Type I inositol polyphosphate 5-phosphatase 5 (At5PTase5) (Protein BRISTLED 1) (Protein DEFORMED ROO T HAIRS 4) n=1 Tax=Cladocopium goreaui TaxID=2562237 RepID=A0A9P1M4H2_9DINO|nr:unnamed protein product [Cladocopium goreaui]